MTALTSTLSPAFAPFAAITEFGRLFAHARRYEQLFAMSDAQLAARGLDRDGLSKAYISGIPHN